MEGRGGRGTDQLPLSGSPFEVLPESEKKDQSGKRKPKGGKKIKKGPAEGNISRRKANGGIGVGGKEGRFHW